MFWGITGNIFRRLVATQTVRIDLYLIDLRNFVADFINLTYPT